MERKKRRVKGIEKTDFPITATVIPISTTRATLYGHRNCPTDYPDSLLRPP